MIWKMISRKTLCAPKSREEGCWVSLLAANLTSRHKPPKSGIKVNILYFWSSINHCRLTCGWEKSKVVNTYFVLVTTNFRWVSYTAPFAIEIARKTCRDCIATIAWISIFCPKVSEASHYKQTTKLTRLSFWYRVWLFNLPRIFLPCPSHVIQILL